jgi:aminoglycoside phosphotransferase (APT) family kinase protein
MKSLRRALELAARHGVPAPRLLYFSEGTVGFAGRPWLIQEFVRGEDGEDAMAGMSETQRTAFFRDFGSGRPPSRDRPWVLFGRSGVLETRGDRAAFAGARLERVADRHFHADLVPRQTIAAARDVIRSMVRAVSAEVRPALVHRDLYLPNTLAAAGRFRCLLDFEHARSSDALSDFVKLQMWVFTESRAPRSRSVADTARIR